ncbi:hypothetical protein [Staphylococcus succinus]|uniref:hypothetical protein n=1 Tax=Staphylococcus succinus TaxID=61015 RepID=UPI000E6A0891|nr:hypothetical protein [Staphylococcus succinus]RIN27729.1 hypothetical protein BU067_01600 [Staphylococcus succinus]
MKKSIVGIVLLVCLTLVLSACGKTSEDKMQGKWKADNSFAMDSIGDSMTIKDHNIKVKGSDEDSVKYFNFKDSKDKEPKHIRFYTEKPNDRLFDKEYADNEGIVHFTDKNTIEIETEMDGTYKFTKE